MTHGPEQRAAGAEDQAFFHALETHRVRAFTRLMRHLPSDPRCAICRAPYGGIGGHLMGRLGFAPSRKNPRLCNACFEKAPVGGVEMEVGILFADVRGFTSLAERQAPEAVAALLNRFYATAVDVLCEHAIIDKLVGDQVMALYLPRVFPGEPSTHMIADAEALLVAAGYGDEAPWIELGVGLDFGTAYVGNVGSGDVKDFTAIGDVVNTAARLQGAAESGEIVCSSRVHMRSGVPTVGLQRRSLDLKGKREPEIAMVRRAGQP
jgi:adenylate cyclase